MIDGSGQATVELALYTDALLIEGRVRMGDESLLGLLSGAGDFLTVEEARVDEHASRGNPVLAPFVRVRLDEVRFALADRAPGIDPDQAPSPLVLLAIPPFVVTGRLGLPDRGDGIRELLAALPGRFVEVLGGAYVSEPLGVAQRRSPVIVVNTSRIQALAPHRDVNPWAGLDQARAAAMEAGVATLAGAGAESSGSIPGLDDARPEAGSLEPAAAAAPAGGSGSGASEDIPAGWR